MRSKHNGPGIVRGALPGRDDEISKCFHCKKQKTQVERLGTSWLVTKTGNISRLRNSNPGGRDVLMGWAEAVCPILEYPKAVAGRDVHGPLSQHTFALSPCSQPIVGLAVAIPAMNKARAI
ncbi:hypothetical protein CB1_002718005 [Camelus ferus]|nr:hypothetical protein CB1_002718005 [Camelus ferus]